MPPSMVSEEPFELVIRLQQFKAECPLDGALVRAHALVKDILLSKLRVDAEIDAQENVRAQGVTDLGKVLAASRALQIAFEGFRDASSAGHTSVAMVLDSPPVVDPDISSITPLMPESDLIRSAKPSQILLTRPFYDRVPNAQSAFRLLPMQGSVYEFLWTNEQKLHQMQAEAERMPALVKEPVPLPERMDTVVPPPDTVIFEPPVKAAVWQHSEGAREPEPIHLDQVRRKGWSGGQIFAFTAGVVLVLLLGWFLNFYVLGGKRAVAPKDTPKPAEAPMVTPPKATATSDTEQPITKVETKTLPAPPQPVVTAKPVRKSHTCAIDGPIPAFLKRAEADSSSGRYDSAIRRFSEILECEPGNREAAQELQKAKDAQKYAP